jgi:hypothetical protein
MAGCEEFWRAEERERTYLRRVEQLMRRGVAHTAAQHVAAEEAGRELAGNVRARP